MEQINPTLASMYGQNVYIDTNVFIYFLEENPLFFSICALFLQAVADGQIIGHTGDAVIAETMVQPYKIGDMAIISRFNDFFHREDFLSIHPHDTSTFELATQISAQQSMKLIDSLHLATAIRKGCQCLITRDDGFKSVGGVRIIQLQDLMDNTL
jgi:predicted nucleic acid-binding protein